MNGKLKWYYDTYLDGSESKGSLEGPQDEKFQSHSGRIEHRVPQLARSHPHHNWVTEGPKGEDYPNLVNAHKGVNAHEGVSAHED